MYFGVLQISLMVVGILSVVAAVNPWTLLPTAVIIVLFVLLRMVYMRTGRDIKRLEGISKYLVQCRQVCQAVLRYKNLRLTLPTLYHNREMELIQCAVGPNYSWNAIRVWSPICTLGVVRVGIQAFVKAFAGKYILNLLFLKNTERFMSKFLSLYKRD